MTYNFNNAIIRKPNQSIQNGLSSQNLHPQYEIVLEEHTNYVKAIKEAGLKINLLEPLEEYPDSIFVEDPAITYKSNIIILDQLEDAQNVGAIFRSALAFNIDGIILTETQSVHENNFMTKTACGGIDKVPFTSVSNLSSALRTLKENGYWVYGLDGSSNKKITEVEFAKKSVFIFGSESDGMRHLTKSLCDEIVKIEISNNLESLNVSNSAAVLFFYLNSNN